MIKKDVVLAIHKKLIAKFGGISGLRDEGLLDSALARFNMVKYYKNNASLFECVAATTYAIIPSLMVTKELELWFVNLFF
jgi:death-on-curing protein